MFTVLLWKAVCSLKSEITLSSSPTLFFVIKTFYGLSRKLPVSPKHCDKAVIYLGKTQMTLDVNTFQR